LQFHVVFQFKVSAVQDQLNFSHSLAQWFVYSLHKCCLSKINVLLLPRLLTLDRLSFVLEIIAWEGLFLSVLCSFVFRFRYFCISVFRLSFVLYVLLCVISVFFVSVHIYCSFFYCSFIMSLCVVVLFVCISFWNYCLDVWYYFFISACLELLLFVYFDLFPGCNFWNTFCSLALLTL
jgi:hypothetical protein